MAAILTVGLMLADLGHEQVAKALEGAVCRALSEGVTTPDLGGSCSTSEVGDHVASNVVSVPVGTV